MDLRDREGVLREIALGRHFLGFPENLKSKAQASSCHDHHPGIVRAQALYKAFQKITSHSASAQPSLTVKEFVTDACGVVRNPG